MLLVCNLFRKVVCVMHNILFSRRGSRNVSKWWGSVQGWGVRRKNPTKHNHETYTKESNKTDEYNSFCLLSFFLVCVFVVFSCSVLRFFLYSNQWDLQPPFLGSSNLQWTQSCPKIDRQKWRQNLKIDWKWKWRNLEIYCLTLKTEKSKEANDWLILELLRFSIFISSSSFWNFQQHCIFNIKWSISKAMPILKPKKRNGQTTSFIFLNTFLHAVWYVFLLDSIPHS